MHINSFHFLCVAPRVLCGLGLTTGQICISNSAKPSCFSPRYPADAVAAADVRVGYAEGGKALQDLQYHGGRKQVGHTIGR